MHSASPFMREAVGFLCPLVFSVTGLLVDGVVFVGDGNDLASALRFALVAGAPALAAIAAINVARDDPHM
jgi:hypothetical protein